MAQGPDHVLAALTVCQQAADGIGAMEGLDEAWTTEIASRLDVVGERLEEVKDRFFIKSKLCLPFAARCARQATSLQAALSSLSDGADATSQQRLSEALAALEKATKALDDRSSMQGMTIT